MAIEETAGDASNALASLLTYTTVFEKLAIVAIGIGIFMLLISPLLHKRMHGVH
jgi:POT family proton-dependent oligopeptide transporter